MSGEKQAEEAIVVSGVSEAGEDGAGGKVEDSTAEDINSGDASDGFSMKSFLWHGGSAWDAWFSCASNQVWSCILWEMDELEQKRQKTMQFGGFHAEQS